MNPCNQKKIEDLTAMHIAGMRERNTAGGGALDAIAAFRREREVQFGTISTLWLGVFWKHHGVSRGFPHDRVGHTTLEKK